MSNAFRRAMSARPTQGARIAVVTAVSLAEMRCTVLVGGGEIVANLNDQTMDLVAVGAVVTLLPVGETYEVISTRTGSGGSGGLTLGPELLANPSFEYGDTTALGWSSWPWVTGVYDVARDTTPGEAVNGDAHARVTLSPGDDDPSAQVWSANAVLLDESTPYQASVWVKAVTGDATLEVTLYTMTAPTTGSPDPFGSGASTHTIATVTNPGGAYQLLTGPFTVPAGHGHGRVYLRAAADAAIPAPVIVAWDVASLRQRITD